MAASLFALLNQSTLFFFGNQRRKENACIHSLQYCNAWTLAQAECLRSQSIFGLAEAMCAAWLWLPMVRDAQRWNESLTVAWAVFQHLITTSVYAYLFFFISYILGQCYVKAHLCYFAIYYSWIYLHNLTQLFYCFCSVVLMHFAILGYILLLPVRVNNTLRSALKYELATRMFRANP